MYPHGEPASGARLRFFVPPWCGDAGGAIGAAVLSLGARGRETIRVPRCGLVVRADWGPEYSEVAITAALRASGLTFTTPQDPVADTVKRLAEGKIVGWFQGKSEFGPRALGQRSILCDPRSEDMARSINSRIKRRYSFQPFAPSVLEEQAGRYFESLGADCHFMTTALAASSTARIEIPAAINQADMTVRPQVVQKRPGWPCPLMVTLVPPFSDSNT